MLVSRKTFGTVLVILCLGIIITAKFPVASTTRSIAIQGFRPVLIASHSIMSFFKNIRSEFRLNSYLKKENGILQNQVQELGNKVIQLQEFESENKRLRLLLELKEQLDYATLPARVIGRDISGWSFLIIIDKGKKDGIVEDMPVVSGEGVVGKTIEVGTYTSKVQLLIDQRSRIGGMMQRSRLVGVVEGTGQGYLIMNYLPRDESVFLNDLVLSSGLGGVFQKGLVIGTVQAVYEEKFGLYKYAKVLPVVHFDKLEEVLIILKPRTNF